MELVEFPGLSTERAELEAFADAIDARKPLVNDPDELLNNGAVLDAVVRSVATSSRIAVA